MSEANEKRLEKRIDDIEKKVDRILIILENDESIGKDGLVKQVVENSKDIKKVKTQLKVFAGIMAGISALFAKLKNLI